jgi:anti-sigma factor RsiW
MGTILVGSMDGRASEAERRELEAHLASCTACATRAEEFRRLWSLLDEAPVIQPSPAFDARLRAQLAAEPPPGFSRWLMPRPRLTLAVVALLLLAAWISSLPPAVPNPPAVVRSEEDFRMIKDLRVLENYDVLADFEALSELPQAQPIQANQEM